MMRDPDARETILVVDDYPVNLRVLIEYLGQSGYKTLVAEDGEGALEQATFARPDLILLDVMMPGIDGFETCRRLKVQDATRDIPVIIMTALSETEHKFKGFQAGAVDYITKPFQQEEVLMRIATHLTLQRQQNELKEALAEVKRLSGLLPICAHCKKIRNDSGYWQQIEAYISERSTAQFSHSICPECAEKLYPDVYLKIKNRVK
jgi:DNA-binding response OmpR family regulator